MNLPQLLDEIRALDLADSLRQLRRMPQTVWGLVLLGALIFLVGFGAASWRIDQTPDIFTDEILYTRLGIRLAADGALVWDSGKPFYVHPPLYFLLESSFLRLFAGSDLPVLEPGDIFHWVYLARTLNALLAGLTAAVLFLLGTRLRGGWWGLLFAGLFLLDPYGIRINRRAMLETLAAFLSLSGMALFITASERKEQSLPRTLLSGLLLGLALLSKELSFTTPLALILYGVWQGLATFGRLPWRKLAAPFLAAGIALTTYLLYPFWMLVSGNWADFSREKLLSLERLLGLVQLTGWNRPGISLLDLLTQRLVDYGSSYLILALGGAASLFIALYGRRNNSGRLVAVWGLLLYPFFFFIALFGSGNDQFFYFLLVPAVVLVSYAVALAGERAARGKGFMRLVMRPLQLLALAFIVCVILPYNLIRWVFTYGVETDNAYFQLSAYIQSNLPPGTAVNATGDPIKFRYFLPDYPITVAGTPAEASLSGTRYFALAPKDVIARYGRITPDLAAWITTHGEPVLKLEGDSYGELYLYRVENTAAGDKAAQAVGSQTGSLFLPASGVRVGLFRTWLDIWAATWILITAGIWLRNLIMFSTIRMSTEIGSYTATSDRRRVS